MSVRETFAERVKKLREEQGLTQRKLAEMVGVSTIRADLYEQAERVPDIETLVRIADALGVSTDYLVGLSDRAIKRTPPFAVMLDEGAFVPTRAHEPDAGADLYPPVDGTVEPGGSLVIDTGVHINIPVGYGGFLKSRSGLNINFSVLNEGVIDAGYTGSIRVKLYNHGEDPLIVERGMRISQIVIQPVVLCGFEVVDRFEETERGDGGFGSTGV